ncbi:coagulation factor 5 8 type domain-containing protein [Fusarium pseudoanthophilum]|uniref:Coagulation factor 5 8 type domain-containing protein n=1 Tax=Fusarium pseudoanthophilum TaxID=48495 RepID=A0A8H5P194_9HYPO|nr:coagulation factor 5 8 type domain-containing protein [Fusarium pseudoanthophilum]
MSSSAGGTAILDRDLLLQGLEDQPWFEKNIPLLDIPDKQIQEVYYYRWQTYKEHLVYTGTKYGYMASEFLNPVSYGAPYGGIVAAVGHHISEVTGDKDFVVGQLANLVKQYRGWDNHYSSSLGLYWQVPVWDATEYTAASYESSDPYHGGAGFRPTINSYQYGDAIAIAKIAALGGESDLENEYRSRAESLRIAVQKHLWDDESKFYKHKARDDNPSGSLLGTREIMGYLPWVFEMPCDESQLSAFSQLKDPQGFLSDFGPTTAERRSKWFMYEADNCCRWDGPSWPFATSQTLTAVEHVLHDYPAQKYLTAKDYYEMLHRYVRTQYRNGQPYVAEAHHPDEDKWMYDGYDHSEDYNHSTFVDNVLAGLIGIRAQSGETVVVNPLTPSEWDYFAVENVAYHGHSITVLWDRTGSVYDRGEGLKVYVDGQLAGSRETIGLIKVEVGPSVPTPVSSQANIVANGQRDPLLPFAFASYTSPADDPMRAINGMIFRTGIPQNSRWTSYHSPNPKDHFVVDLRIDQAVDNVRLFFYDDSDGVRIPTSYDLQYWTGNAWVEIPDQVRTQIPTSSNAETKIVFPSIVTSRLRVEAPNAGSGVGWGLSEFEIWTSGKDLS